jgi:hypothetical protein
MESYVVRIYRRQKTQPEKVVGLVEHPENGSTERFSGMSELVSILLTPHPVESSTKTAEESDQLGLAG